ncbi:hypothetical protein [Methylocystis echinoides]|uniref:hypothetical protein n=1 Tax=Methylocystis echinoides TaxID=29468 RepID=UPI003443FD8C
MFDILVICVLRYGLSQDKRYALAALVACQALHDVPRTQLVGYVEGRLTELQARLVASPTPHSKVDESYATLAAFIRSMGLAKALKGDRTLRFDSDRAKLSLRRIAPQLAEAIDACDRRSPSPKTPRPLQAVA